MTAKKWEANFPRELQVWVGVTGKTKGWLKLIPCYPLFIRFILLYLQVFAEQSSYSTYE